MGFERRFTLGLVLRAALLMLALLAFVAAMMTPGLAAARILAGLLVGLAIWALWHHVERTNLEVARFIEALRLSDLSAHFDSRSQSGFAELGEAMTGAIRTLRRQRQADLDELRYLEALVDDMPVALLTIDGEGRIEPGNKAARRLFVDHHGVRADDYAVYGATFAARLADGGPAREEMLILNLGGRAKRALVRSASLSRLGQHSRAVIVQPVQETLNAVEMAAQTDIVRVLTHEILNSLTPVTSLAATAESLLEPGAPDEAGRIADARSAVATLARRADGLAHFIASYRSVATEPRLDRRRFEAMPFVEELARLFAANWPDARLDWQVEPANQLLDADPDLLAQVVINLLRNAVQAATEHGAAPEVSLRVTPLVGAETRIEIGDNGPGIPAELRSDVFLPFFTTRAQGTGVGLNFARQTIVAHGGSIELGDSPRGGALVRIVL